MIGHARLATAVVSTLLIAACTGGSEEDGAATTASAEATTAPATTNLSGPLPTPEPTAGEPRQDSPDDRAMSPLRELPLPTPVRYRRRSETRPVDPRFTALAGARAYFGHLGGSVYQIEIADDWNGRLVMWMHGFGSFAPETRAAPPDFRRYLIANGYAWAASSYSSSSFIPGRGADETAALWDFFVGEHGRPTWTYAAGLSMGGWSAEIAAERYADRYDGALALCGAAGIAPGLGITADMFVVGAYVAGVTQAEYDAASSVDGLIEQRIKPALDDARRREQFEAMMIDLTGGRRSFDREGFRDEEETNWTRAAQLVAARLVPPRTAPYTFREEVGVSNDEFNGKALHIQTNDEAFRQFTAGMEVTGDLRMPLLTMHTTGDGQSPIGQAVELRRVVDAAGRSDLLVQRVIEDPGHCGFTTGEQEAALRALLDWAEHGRVPPGTDLSNEDLIALDRTFELVRRENEDDAEQEASAGRQAIIRGRATLDGTPLDARWIGAVVEYDGLVTPCNTALPPIRNGRFEIGVFSRARSAGCGRPGSVVHLWTYVSETKIFAASPVAWPEDGTTDVVVDFSARAPQGAAPLSTEFAGEVYRRDGTRVRHGTRVAAYVNGKLCGVATVRPTDFYIMAVAGPDGREHCAPGGTITFRVGGRRASETVTNSPDQSTHLELTL